MVETIQINERIDPNDVDALLAAELNELTFHERERINEELHGVMREVEETSELLNTSLDEMEHALQRLPDRAIYDQATCINPGYVEDRSFRLMFLRSEYFNAQKAAERLVKFLENKVKLFGEQTLTRQVYLNDFKEDDMDLLKTGIIQLIPARDQSGRAIVADFNMCPNFVQPKDIDNYIKTVVYTILAAAEDEETQKRGLIGIFYFTNAIPIVQRLHERNAKVFEWLPLRVVGLHFCFDDTRFQLFKALLMLLIGKERRVRLRVHEGSHTECQYKLMTFGLPVNHFPVTYEGELKTAGHLKWLARRQIREEALQSVGTFRGIDIPGSKDALFGRGKTIQDHNGNVLMRSLIEEYMPEYRRAAKKEKGKVAWKVVMATKALGGRFLKRDSTGWWVEVTDEIAREKISMTYRTSRSTDSPHETNVVEQPRVDHGQNKEDDNDTQVIERDSKRSRRRHDHCEEEGIVDYSLRSSSGACNRICFDS